jgi:hypothetical protein
VLGEPRVEAVKNSWGWFSQGKWALSASSTRCASGILRLRPRNREGPDPLQIRPFPFRCDRYSGDIGDRD